MKLPWKKVANGDVPFWSIWHYSLLKKVDILIFVDKDPDCYAPAMFLSKILIYQLFIKIKLLESTKKECPYYQLYW